MGYFANGDMSLIIPNDQLDEALDALIGYVVSEGHDKTERTDEPPAGQIATILSWYGYEFDSWGAASDWTANAAGIEPSEVTQFSGYFSSKWRDYCVQVLDAIAPFVIPTGSGGDFAGEDHCIWRIAFGGGHAHELEPTIIWPEVPSG